MQTKDHYLLGCFILKQYGSCVDPICQKLFLLGCIEPDWNLITYTRGSIKYQFLHGHNAENSQKHLNRLTEKLLKSGVHTTLQWFRFGAALYYLADSRSYQTDCRYILSSALTLCGQLSIRCASISFAACTETEALKIYGKV